MAFGTSARTLGSSTTDITAFLKNRYPQRKIEDLVAFGKPLFSALPKSDELTGNKTIMPIEVDSPQGMSSSLSTAVANASSTVGVDFAITTADFYGGLTIDAKSMMAFRNNEGAFFRLRERQYQRQLEQMGQVFEASLWSSGTGSLGTISSEPTGAEDTATLTNAEDALKFHENMKVDFYADSSGDPSGAARAGGSYTITAVNYDTGVLTFSGNLNSAVAATDHIVRQGDLDAYVKGVPAWIPSADPTTSFFGVDRTNYPQKLGGWRQSWLGSIEETAKKLDSKIRRVSQRPKTLWLSFANFNRLDLELGARGYRKEDGGKGTFGRSSLMMSTPGGGVEVKAAPYLGDDVGFLLDMSTWKICTLGALPHLVQDDGLSAIRIGAAATGASNGAEDGIEIRLRAFWQLVCMCPFANGRIAIS